jgi:NCS1 family nucleobase:cation symporter-1
MVMCIPAYLVGQSDRQRHVRLPGGATVFLANAIVLLPMLLIGHAGTKYGIPYAVLARASFGTAGARCRR